MEANLASKAQEASAAEETAAESRKHAEVKRTSRIRHSFVFNMRSPSRSEVMITSILRCMMPLKCAGTVQQEQYLGLRGV